MSVINIKVLSSKFLVDRWDVFVYGRGWPHASQVCCDKRATFSSQFYVHVKMNLCVCSTCKNGKLLYQIPKAITVLGLYISYTKKDNDRFVNKYIHEPMRALCVVWFKKILCERPLSHLLTAKKGVFFSLLLLKRREFDNFKTTSNVFCEKFYNCDFSKICICV